MRRRMRARATGMGWCASEARAWRASALRLGYDFVVTTPVHGGAAFAGGAAGFAAAAAAAASPPSAGLSACG